MSNLKVCGLRDVQFKKKEKQLKSYQNPIFYVLPFTLWLLGYEVALSQTPMRLHSVTEISKNRISQKLPPALVPSSPLRIVVNSNQDTVQADDQLTLREAIELVNGTLSVSQLSSAEKALVQPLNDVSSRIEFNLPANATTILLQKELPALTSPGLVIDGSTQPGYKESESATAEIAIPVPVVSIASAPKQEIIRGLTIVGDRITIRGLNLYGFNAQPIKQQLGSLLVDDGKPKPTTLTTPPGDIVIAHSIPPNNNQKDVPPKNVVIENNWLGLTIDEKIPAQTSAFGVYVFNAQGAKIRRNRIYYHDGSAIITSVKGENTLVQENIIVGNGIAGMPDALRIEGIVGKSQITGNLICANDGAGVYLFKPEGDVSIRDNRIIYNGRRLRRAAVFLTGNNHQVTGNQITNQTGPGVVVSAFPQSQGNIIQNNSFAALEGLSIDLNTQGNLDVSDWQRGDGPNPPRNSPNRRLETGNGAINAPEFMAREFVPNGNQVTVQGKADPGSEVTIYRLGDYQQGKQALYQPGYGALSQVLATAPVDAKGNFSLTLENLQVGDVVSAIATDPKYGTSEPAFGSIIGAKGTVPNISPAPKIDPTNIPQCTSRPVPPTPPTPPVRIEVPPTPLRLKVPRNIHFALDKSFISPASAIVLDRIAQVLRQYPVIVIEIQGHTDPRAGDAYNLALGKRRALATRNYLLRQGVAPERMTIRSFGERQLLSNGNDRIDYARDRRAEIIFKDIRGIDIIMEGQEQDLQIEPSRGKR